MSKKFLIGMMGFIVISLIGMRLVFTAGISNTAHDFRGETWNPGANAEICVVCHTPHNALSTLVPLWNHATTTATFTTYSSGTLNATVPTPEGASKACLSCHDGTVAFDSFGGATGSTTFAPTDKKNLGTNLSNDHPVSFTYDTGLATTDGGLYDPTVKTVAALGGKTITAGMLVADKVECNSCHDVHASKGNSATASKLLLVDNGSSALCLTCHNK